jgi:predicted xylose isomerase-like sugar epimerase
MKDTFNMGYDLQQAGFDFAAVNQRNEHNLELLNGIAEDFVKASFQKAGIKCDKEEVLYRFDEALPAMNSAEPVLIVYADSAAALRVKFINRSSPLFTNLFVEELAKA